MYLDRNAVKKRYKRLLYACREAAILTETEAVAVINAYRTEGKHAMPGEAVAHFGGAGKVIQAAIRCRHRTLVRRLVKRG